MSTTNEICPPTIGASVEAIGVVPIALPESGTDRKASKTSSNTEPIDRLLLKHVLQNIREAVLFVGPEQKILAWNRAAESLIGINYYVQADLDWLFSHIHLTPRAGRSAASGDISVRDAIIDQIELLQYATMSIDGRPATPVDVQVVPLLTPQESCLGSLILLHDASYKVNMQQQVQQLMAKSISDPLTGLANRAEFERILETCCQHFKVASTDLSLIVCDIDFFKSINDAHGHTIGDQALIAFASFLQRTIRDADFVARFGGEEFVIVCNNCNGAAAVDCAEKVRVRLNKTPLGCLGQKCLSASFGVAQFGRHDTGGSLFERADQALLRAKESGRNRVVFGDLQENGETRFVSGSDSNKEQWQASGEAVICQEFTTSSPIEVLGAKIEGFVLEQQAKIKLVEPMRVVIHTTDVASGIFRRSNDRRVGLKIDLQFKEISAQVDGSDRFGPKTLLQVSISVLRQRDRRQADIKQHAELVLRGLCGYLMLQSANATEPEPHRPGRR